uniref:Uncharacterized protein n=1 Tax=Hanusia phi TaxID=3032 RepID=A0A6T7S7B0_9CRYP|mmetsp:Transcript_33703/g.75709  ORF Transcript_33703/g.75709 Transcript_33703/m.75709 type:complete len:159 (+) Transcript_33703:172-648(+)
MRTRSLTAMYLLVSLSTTLAFVNELRCPNLSKGTGDMSSFQQDCPFGDLCPCKSWDRTISVHPTAPEMHLRGSEGVGEDKSSKETERELEELGAVDISSVVSHPRDNLCRLNEVFRGLNDKTFTMGPDHEKSSLSFYSPKSMAEQWHCPLHSHPKSDM